MLKDAIPGTPGEDYPIYAEAPETKFTCDGKLNGGRSNTIKSRWETEFFTCNLIWNRMSKRNTLIGISWNLS